MKKKSIIVLCILVVLGVGYSAFQYWSAPTGNTIESREEILRGTPKGTIWNIAVEQEFENYLLCGIYADNGKSGVAVFEPKGKGYELVSREWRSSSDEIIISGFSIDGDWYDIVWFNGAVTSYAELTYTSEGKTNTLRFETDENQIICNPCETKDYTLKAVYYDNDGNVYE